LNNDGSCWRVVFCLLASFACVAWLSAQSAAADERSDVSANRALFHAVGFLYGIDANLLEAIAAVESSFDPNAVSPKGAQGMMQLMPETSKQFGVANPFDRIESTMGAARFLEYLSQTLSVNDRDLEDKLQLLIAAYHAGEGPVFKYKGVPPYDDTQEYVRRVMRAYRSKTSRPRIDSPPLVPAVATVPHT
jgi:soluble lytic murein transglycosylase-like protein